MFRAFDHEFDDVSAMTDERGFEAGSFNGVATIKFDSDGSWGVTSISLEAFRGIDPTAPTPAGAYRRRHNGLTAYRLIHLDPNRDVWLFNALRQSLEDGREADNINEAVAEALDAERQPDPDHRYRERRDSTIGV